MKIRTKVPRREDVFFKIWILLKELYRFGRRRPVVVAVLYTTTFGVKEALREVSWIYMRLALKLINHSLGLN